MEKEGDGFNYFGCADTKQSLALYEKVKHTSKENLGKEHMDLVTIRLRSLADPAIQALL